jgi:hypothetical protein
MENLLEMNALTYWNLLVIQNCSNGIIFYFFFKGTAISIQVIFLALPTRISI